MSQSRNYALAVQSIDELHTQQEPDNFGTAASENEDLLQSLGTVLDRIQVIANATVDAVDAVAKVHPYADTAWKVLSLVYKAYQHRKETDANVVSRFDKMAALYSFVDDLEEGLPSKITRLKPTIAGSFTGYTNRVNSVVFSPDGQRIALGSWDNTICVWDAESGALKAGPFIGHTEPVNSVVFSPDGQRITSRRDPMIRPSAFGHSKRGNSQGTQTSLLPAAHGATALLSISGSFNGALSM
ncbi:hypothetical protein FIBSPDRAFT_1054893 [Athelia psychrophila]|uniref:Uncharacterized protein n=1 Tax=Athelia psychrophila TaxID=1759441 RepID=A0A167UNR4_9AGAM|nr:hypothetical protein FIBSPDRAFT_1054893 [Fibularhizoctonia sp. CBS 109695]